MIDLIKPYINITFGVCLILLLGYTHFKAYQAGENHIKEINRDESQKAVNEKQRIEKEQNEKYTTAQTGYAGALDELNRRLRDAETMPRRKDMSVAGSNVNQGTMPSETTDTARTQIKLKSYKGTCDVEFYNDALRDNLQCEELIKLIK